jgi:hypothetical protein
MKRTFLFAGLSMLPGIIFMAEAGEGNDLGGAAAPKGAAIRPNTDNYQTAKSASGSTTKHSGDAVAVALVGATLEETYGFVSKIVGVAEDVLREKYGNANVGQQRMFLGNLIRGGMATKDAEKAARIESAFAENVTEFRVAIDARQEESAKLLAEEKQKKADEKAKIQADLKAEREKKAADAKLARETAAAEKAAAKPAKVPAAPKEPKQPAE